MASTGQGRQRCVDAAAFTSNEIQSTNNNMQNITSLNTRNKKRNWHNRQNSCDQIDAHMILQEIQF